MSGWRVHGFGDDGGHTGVTSAQLSGQLLTRRPICSAEVMGGKPARQGVPSAHAAQFQPESMYVGSSWHE